jgi:hypothetical protein
LHHAGCDPFLGDAETFAVTTKDVGLGHNLTRIDLAAELTSEGEEERREGEEGRREGGKERSTVYGLV